MPPSLDFRTILDRSPNPYMVLDRELKYVWANEEYLRATSSTLDAIVGRHILDAFPDDPADPNSANRRLLRESLERVLATGAPDVLAFIPYRIGDEERSWSATHTPILDGRGEVAFILQHTVDITELHRLRHNQKEAGVLQRAQQVQDASVTLDAERRHLRRLFEQAPGFMAFLRGRDHVFELANRTYLQLVGGRDIVGKPVREALPEVATQGFIDLLDQVLATGEPFVGRGARVLLQRQSDAPLEEVFLDFVYQPIVDGHGVTGIFVQGHDVTEQYRARAEAERANRLKDEFLATLSHELRTPLNAMLGWARILRTQPMEPVRLERALGVIERNALLQAQLVQDLLDVSAITNGKLRLNIGEVVLRDVVSAAIEVVKPAADAKRMAVVVTGTAPVVGGDTERLRQVVWNLLSNAVKFTPAGGHIEARLGEWDEGVTLTVTDTGVGIAPEFLPHVFERFRQGEAGPDRPHGGLGLGLSIVKHVVEAHGGSVEASSAGRGHGATFVIRLPGKDVSQSARQAS